MGMSNYYRRALGVPKEPESPPAPTSRKEPESPVVTKTIIEPLDTSKLFEGVIRAPRRSAK